MTLDERLERIESMLGVLIYNKEVLTLNEVSAYSGYSLKTLYKLTSAKDIPHYKQGGKLFFRRSEVDGWLTRHKVKSNDEITTEAINYINSKKLNYGRNKHPKAMD